MKKLVIIVDMQNDFIHGSLGFEEAEAVVDAIVAKLSHPDYRDYDRIFTRDSHGSNYLDTQEGQRLPVEHCIMGTQGWEIDERLHPFMDANTLIFNKPTFPSLTMGVYLDTQYYDEIEIMGLVSNICVISNAVIAKAACPEARIVVDASCTASFDTDLHAQTLNVLKGLQVDVL